MTLEQLDAIEELIRAVIDVDRAKAMPEGPTGDRIRKVVAGVLSNARHRLLIAEN